MAVIHDNYDAFADAPDTGVDEIHGYRWAKGDGESTCEACGMPIGLRRFMVSRLTFPGSYGTTARWHCVPCFDFAAAMDDRGRFARPRTPEIPGPGSKAWLKAVSKAIAKGCRIALHPFVAETYERKGIEIPENVLPVFSALAVPARPARRGGRR